MKTKMEVPIETVQKLISNAFFKAFRLKRNEVEKVEVAFFSRAGYSDDFLPLESLKVVITVDMKETL